MRGSVLSTVMLAHATTLSSFVFRAVCKSVWSERVPVIVPHTPFAEIVLSVNSERLGL